MKRFLYSRMFLLSAILLSSLSGLAQPSIAARIYELWDDQPAPNRGKDYSHIQSRGYPADPDWEAHSYPIGNGYMGANVFGRTDVERIQLTEKTLANEGLYGKGGLTNFAEIYLEFDHYHPTDYKRSLNLNEGILYVKYTQAGVRYTREYLANYPENVIAIRLSSDQPGQLSFTLRAEIPYRRSENEINTKFGTTQASGDLLTLAGTVKHFGINYEGQIKVIPEGGKIFASQDNGAEIRVEGADAAVLLIAAGTNYELSEKVFLQDTNHLKLDAEVFPHETVSRTIERASERGYEGLKTSHLRDYQRLFGRVNLQLSAGVPDLPTRTVVARYQQDPSQVFLEELMFHYGRYLLIASSRKGTLPCGLQGAWSQYHVTPWTGGYWHNINVQMNYWGAFSANLMETFDGYLEYFQAFLPYAEKIADGYIEKNNPAQLAQGKASNGWSVGTGATAYIIGHPGGHSGPGTAGFTSKLFWERYAFTLDTAFLREIGYPVLLGTSIFLSKTVKPAENGLLLVDPSASPEIRLQDEKGGYSGPHYTTVGTTFDQGFVWEAHHDLLEAASLLGASDPHLQVAKDQLGRLDPILVGASGQIKEYREEAAYGEIGDPHHRHISHLCPIYPGTLINSSKPAWMEAVRKTLDFRGNQTTGWAMAHRMNVRARTKEGEKARAVYARFLQERALPNLWTVHPPFQIDGNLGTMAGVVEMLVQSHEGYIDLLPALPAAWENGSFAGLVARGNVELSLSWQQGKVVSLTLHAKRGGPCVLKCADPDQVQVMDQAGKRIPFSLQGSGLISFETVPAGKYQVAF